MAAANERHHTVMALDENGGMGQPCGGTCLAPYTWTPEAQARLERAPEGFMRECTKALIDQACGQARRRPHHG